MSVTDSYFQFANSRGNWLDRETRTVPAMTWPVWRMVIPSTPRASARYSHHMRFLADAIQIPSIRGAGIAWHGGGHGHGGHGHHEQGGFLPGGNDGDRRRNSRRFAVVCVLAFFAILVFFMYQAAANY